MAEDALIIEVAESGFDRYVIGNSHKVPVVVVFMAMWSGPCMAMAHVIETLARRFAGQFVFAKVDSDEQPALLKQYEVEHVPALLIFQQGEVSFRQEGQMQEEELRLLLKGMGIYSQSDELRQLARAKHLAGETSEAILMMSQAIQLEPGNSRVAMDMVQIFIDIGEVEQAKGLFNKLPNRDRESDMGKSLIGQLTFADLAAKTAGASALEQRLAQNADDHDARFDLAVCMVAMHDYNAAIDQLFTILRSQADYREGAAKEMIITVTNMLAPNDAALAASYRQRLANMING